MQSPLHRLYKTKLVLASFIGIVAGYVLMVVGSRIDASSGFGFLKDVDLHDIGIVLMTSGLIAVLFTYLGNENAEADAEARTRRAVKAEAPAFVSSVVNAMANAPQEMLTVTADEVLDRVVENSLAQRLHNPELAAGVFADLKAQVLRSRECWYDLRISAALTPWTGAPPEPSAAMYVATFRYEYHVVNPPQSLRFACVSDLAEYRELQNDPDVAEVWYFQAKGGLDATSLEVFELVEVSVAGKPQKIRRTTQAGAQYYSVRLNPDLDATNGIAVSFMYRALVQQHGHVLHVDLIKPTHGVTIGLSYGGSGIRYINMVDYIASATQPVISQTLATDPSPSVSVSFDGWVLPKAGVAFVWVLDSEMSTVSRKYHGSIE
jgi:hypothetical protein